MQIRSTDPSRSRSLDDIDELSKTHPAAKATVDHAAPDWDRIPTLDTGSLSAIRAGSDDSKALMPKLEKLERDVKELHDALAPYARECKELHHGMHEIEEAIHMVKEAKHLGFLAPAGVGFAIAKAEHGVHAMQRGWAGMKREAPEAARKAEPAMKKVIDDIIDLKATIRPSVDRPVSLRG